MSQLFSTELLPASDRVDAWQWNAKQICGDCQVRFPKVAFHGTIDAREVGGLRLTRFTSSPLAFSKWPGDWLTPDNRFCIVITQIAGARHYQQAGQSVLLTPGDSTLIDSARPWSSTCETDCARLYLRAPRWLMESRLGRSDIPTIQRISGESRSGAVLFRLSQSLYEDAGRMIEEEVAVAMDAYFEILSVCLEGSHSPVPRAAELRARIHRYIDQHLGEPTLGPLEIASALGISVRHVHRLFLVTGNTLGDYIRSRRLHGCRRDLLNPRLRDKTITEIAFCWGFSDSAHFSHAFRKYFGVSPRAFRAQIAGQQGAVLEAESVADLIADMSEFHSRPN